MMNRATAFLIAIWAGALATSAVAKAGVLSGGECFRNSCRLEYRGLSREANRVTARTLRNNELLLTDTGGVIRNEAGCRTLSPHSVMCSIQMVGEKLYPEVQSQPPARTSLVIRGGDGGDLIDARHVGLGIDVEIIGGTGNDKLYAADGGSVLIAGGGHDLLVGNRSTDLDFSETTGLFRGTAVAPREHAHIVGIGLVRGGRGTNHIIGGKTPGTRLVGGPGRNYLVSNLPGTELLLDTLHKPSTVICGHEARVYGLERNDLALGNCRTKNPVLQMLLPLKSLSSPVIELPTAWKYREVNLLTVPQGRRIGRVSFPASTMAPQAAYCYLSHAGQALVRRMRHLLVRVEAVLPVFSFEPLTQRVLTFKTVIDRP
jgi:hypothetical protein